jgi:hypothetical protein
MLMLVQEVEREVQEGAGDDGGAGRRGRKRRVEEVLEYCYEPEMEATYQRSLLRAFQKVVKEARFKFVVVDAPALKASTSGGSGNGYYSSGSPGGGSAGGSSSSGGSSGSGQQRTTSSGSHSASSSGSLGGLRGRLCCACGAHFTHPTMRLTVSLPCPPLLLPCPCCPAPALQVADFRDFWSAGQGAGYEVYVAEPPETDPQVSWPELGQAGLI